MAEMQAFRMMFLIRSRFLFTPRMDYLHVRGKSSLVGSAHAGKWDKSEYADLVRFFD